MSLKATTPESTRASDARANSIISLLTIEGSAYIAITALAFLVRFIALGDVPLNSTEARQALAAFGFSQGMATGFTGSPFLFTANALIFTLFAASDFTARIAPALAGVALVPLPVFFRRDLGRTGALAASVSLAFSPSLVLFSRTLEGAIPAVTISLVVVAFGMRYLETRSARELYLTFSFIALAILTAPDVWTISLALVFFYAAMRMRITIPSRALHPESLSHPQAADAEKHKFNALILFAIVFFSVSTTFMFHREGVGAAFDLLAIWLDSLRLGASLLEGFRLLLVYEPLVFFFGIGVLVDLIFGSSAKKWSGLHGLLAIWVVTTFVLLSLSVDHNPSRVVFLVVPLTLLAGTGIGGWCERAIKQARALGAPELLWHEVPIITGGFGLMAFLSIVVAGGVQHGNIAVADVFGRMFGFSRDNAGIANSLALILFLFSFVLAAVLALTTLGRTRAINVGIFLVLIILSQWTFRQTMMLNFTDTGALNPQEWLVSEAASANLRDLVRDLESQSRWRANDTHSLVIVAETSLGSIIQWNLRDFRYARFESGAASTAGVQAIVAANDAPAPAGSWIQQKYELELTRGIENETSLRALIYRDTGSVQASGASLWVQPPQGK